MHDNVDRLAKAIADGIRDLHVMAESLQSELERMRRGKPAARAMCHVCNNALFVDGVPCTACQPPAHPNCRSTMPPPRLAWNNKPVVMVVPTRTVEPLDPATWARIMRARQERKVRNDDTT